MTTNVDETMKNKEDVVEVVGKDGPWSASNEAIFVEIMDEEVKLHSRATGTFQKEAWPRMRKKLMDKTSYPYTENQIRNKFNQLRTMHTKFVSLCKQSGVGWCPINGTVTADDEVWERLYQVNKKAKHFKKKGFKHYAVMTRVLGDTTATGLNAHASTQSPSETDSSEPIGIQIKEEEGLDDMEVQRSSRKGKMKDVKLAKSSDAKESSKSRKRDSFSANLTESLSVIAESNRKKVEILEAKHMAKSTNSVSSPGRGDSDKLLKECMNVLNAMEELEGKEYAVAVKTIKEDPGWRSIFLDMPENRKKDWIMNLTPKE